MYTGRTHRINLGRIAPNSVLGMYVTTGSLADDVFHPETVIASTLVHAYTIGKTVIPILYLPLSETPVTLAEPDALLVTANSCNNRQTRFLQPPAEGHALRDREDHR